MAYLGRKQPKFVRTAGKIWFLLRKPRSFKLFLTLVFRGCVFASEPTTFILVKTKLQEGDPGLPTPPSDSWGWGSAIPPLLFPYMPGSALFPHVRIPPPNMSVFREPKSYLYQFFKRPRSRVFVLSRN